MFRLPSRLPDGLLQHRLEVWPLGPQWVQGAPPPPVSLDAAPPSSIGMGAGVQEVELTGPFQNVREQLADGLTGMTGLSVHPG